MKKALVFSNSTLWVVVLLNIMAIALLLTYTTDKPRMHYEQLKPTKSKIPILLTDKKIYKSGGFVFVKVKICADESQQYVISQRLTNVDTHDFYILSGSVVQAEKGCNVISGIPKGLPSDLKPGRYYVDGQSQVKGRIRTFVLPWRTETFTVIGGE